MSRYADPRAERSRERRYANSYQSPSRAPIYVEKENWYQEEDCNLPTGTVPGTTRIPSIQFDEYMGDDGSLREHPVNGSGWSRSVSSFFPMRPSWTTSKLREHGPQSLSKIRNRDTISKDKTAGDRAQIDNLFATYGRKAMGMTYQEQRKDTSPDYAWFRAFAGSGCKQENCEFYMISQPSKQPLGFRSTYVGKWYIETDDDKDNNIELGECLCAIPQQKQSITLKNNLKINILRLCSECQNA